MTACQVCTHPDRPEIDRRLASPTPPNYSAIGRLFGVDHEAVGRHHRSHLPAVLVKANQLQEVAAADVILSEVRSSMADLDRIAGKAEAKGDHRGAAVALKSKATFLHVLVAAGSLLLEERRLRNTEPTAEKKLLFADIESAMKAKIERELTKRQSEEGTGVVDRQRTGGSGHERSGGSAGELTSHPPGSSSAVA